ncbi:hypothetical protein LXA20_17530, partial [Erwinia amylovora]|uniref:hypothetical protein n=1 Tax=Erwinia amylovora TaxID=552 RepID=UPI0020BFFC40
AFAVITQQHMEQFDEVEILRERPIFIVATHILFMFIVDPFTVVFLLLRVILRQSVKHQYSEFGLSPVVGRAFLADFVQ